MPPTGSRSRSGTGSRTRRCCRMRNVSAGVRRATPDGSVGRTPRLACPVVPVEPAPVACPSPPGPGGSLRPRRARGRVPALSSRSPSTRAAAGSSTNIATRPDRAPCVRPPQSLSHPASTRANASSGEHRRSVSRGCTTSDPEMPREDIDDEFSASSAKKKDSHAARSCVASSATGPDASTRSSSQTSPH